MQFLLFRWSANIKPADLPSLLVIDSFQYYEPIELEQQVLMKAGDIPGLSSSKFFNAIVSEINELFLCVWNRLRRYVYPKSKKVYDTVCRINLFGLYCNIERVSRKICK